MVWVISIEKLKKKGVDEMKPAKKYETIIADMKREIKEKNIQPHEMFFTDQSAMQRYGVSRITIRRAFAQLEHDGLIYRVRGRGTMISPNPGRRSRLFAFLGQSLVRNGIEPVLIKGMEDFLLQHDSSLILCNVEDDPARAQQYIQRFAQMGIDGIFYTPMLTSPERNIEMMKLMKSRKIPFILVVRLVPGFDHAHYVIPDNYEGGRLVTQHLISLGHRRIVFFRSVDPTIGISNAERRRGYMAALAAAGIEHDPELDVFSPMGTVPLYIKRWQGMSDPPTAVFADNDISLVRFLEMANQQGIRVPEDMSVAGFDNLTHIPMPIPQTTVNVPYYELGQTAASQLLHVVENDENAPQQIVMPVSLVIRQTTGINPQLQHVVAQAK